MTEPRDWIKCRDQIREGIKDLLFRKVKIEFIFLYLIIEYKGKGLEI